MHHILELCVELDSISRRLGSCCGCGRGSSCGCGFGFLGRIYVHLLELTLALKLFFSRTQDLLRTILQFSSLPYLRVR